MQLESYVCVIIFLVSSSPSIILYFIRCRDLSRLFFEIINQGGHTPVNARYHCCASLLVHPYLRTPTPPLTQRHLSYGGDSGRHAYPFGQRTRTRGVFSLDLAVAILQYYDNYVVASRIVLIMKDRDLLPAK